MLVACASASASVTACREHVVRWQDGISLSAAGVRSMADEPGRPLACRSARGVARRLLGARLRCRLYDGGDGRFRGACTTGRFELRWRQRDLPP